MWNVNSISAISPFFFLEKKAGKFKFVPRLGSVV
jgi:hypothetical protein